MAQTISQFYHLPETLSSRAPGPRCPGGVSMLGQSISFVIAQEEAGKLEGLQEFFGFPK